MNTVTYACLVVASFIGLFHLGALALKEVARFRECVSRCEAAWDSNERLIRASMCTDSDERRSFGESMDTLCRRAAEENSHGPTLARLFCTSSMYWREGQIHDTVSMFVTSPLMMLAVVVPCLVYGIHMIFASYNERKQREHIQSMMNDTFEFINKKATPQLMRRAGTLIEFARDFEDGD